jgi:hypothetical protein
VLVSERHAVWTGAQAAAHATAKPSMAALLADLADPLWDHANGTRWTPELVHCRLLEAADTICRLPGASMGRVRSLLGQLADPDPDAVLNIRSAPTPAQASVADWTIREIIAGRMKAGS